MATEEKLREYLKRATVDLAEARRRLAEVEESRHEPVAIVGMACRFPGAPGVGEYWDLLRDGRSGIVEVPASRWNIDDYYTEDRRAIGGVYTRHGGFLDDIAGWDAEFFGVSPQEALRMDPHQRLLMELLWEGLEDAGTSPTRLAGSRTGVMVGYMDTVQYGRLESERYGAAVAADPYFGQGVSASVVAGRLAYQYDLRGPAVTIDTACSSSLVGVHLAAQALRRGECDLAVAAGVFLIMQPDTYVQACATSMLAPDGRCKTFDASADGYAMGEGGGIVVLERLSSALRNGRRIRAVLRGSAVNQDGRSNGLTAPSRSAQVDVIRRALTAARVEPDDVDFVEAHGSGTHLGDAIELSALHDVFGDRPSRRSLPVGAVKTNIGHTQSAAGVAGLIKTVLTVEHGVVPPNLHLTEPAAAIPGDGSVAPVTALSPLPAGRRIAGVSSFGWSGTNTHLVLEAAPAAASGDTPAVPAAAGVTLPVSAGSPTALGEQLTRLRDWLAGHPELELADVAHTLATGRGEHDHRRAVTVTGRDDALAQLASAAAQPGVDKGRGRPRVAFLLAGVGDQYRGLGRELYASEPVYAAAVDACVAILDERCGVDLRPYLDAEPPAAPEGGDLVALLRRDDSAEDPFYQAEIAHPYQFTVEYALAKLLTDKGISPEVVLGYSLGEYVGACLAGVFTLADALHLVVERARLIATAPAGRMVAAAADGATVRAALGTIEVDVAAENGPAMTVLSGLPADIEAASERLRAAGVAFQPLRTPHAFHSSLLEPVRSKLAALVGAVPRQAPTITIVSNRTGEPLTAEQATSAEYWAEHLVSPVRFAQSVQHCAAAGVDVFVELGAGQTLGGLVRQNLTPATPVAVLGTLPASWATGAGPVAALRDTIARLWERGAPVDWPAVQGTGRVVTLPGYPFQRTRFWPEPGSAMPAATQTQPTDLCYAPTWRRTTTTTTSAARTSTGTPSPTGTLPTTGTVASSSAAPAQGPFALGGPLVVFSDGPIGSALAARAAAGGTPVIEVLTRGDGGTEGLGAQRDGDRITIDPAVPAHYREVFAGLPEGPVHVAHLWSLTAPTGTTEEALRAAMALSHDSLLLAIQGLSDLPGKHGVRLLTVSAGGVEVLGGDAVAPSQVAGHGLARVADHEYAGLRWSGVDLDPDTDPAAAATQLGYELVTDPGAHPAVVAWRRNRRWLPDWEELSTVDRTSPWRSEGVYLITGGTRGLGLSLARHLAGAGVRKLALVGRSSLDDGSERATNTRKDLEDLERQGVQVLHLTADTGKPDQLRDALTSAREHFGALHGVIHAAGAPASGMVARTTVDAAATVLAPKVAALGPLAELIGPESNERPELLVLYSSAVTAFGGIGEGDYCAANTVLDAYGAALAATSPDTRVVTVAWGPWQHDDWQVAAAGGAGGGLAQRAGEYRRRFGFTDEGGCAFLDAVLRNASGSVVAVRQRMEQALVEWTAMLDIDALVGGATAMPSAERFPRPQLRIDYAAPRNDLETLVAEVWGAYLGIDRVGIHDPFFDLGGNSLVGMAMVHAVEKQIDATIAPAVLFEHPTVAQFAAALEQTGDGREALVSSSDRGQRRRRARPATRK
jgi:acyl transferase domain-containing protein